MRVDSEVALKRKVQVMVICAMTAFFVLLTVLTFLLAVRINQTTQIRQLESSNAYLRTETANALSDTEYYKRIHEFAEDYALLVRGWGRPGSQIFN
jgi:hypothetical protein